MFRTAALRRRPQQEETLPGGLVGAGVTEIDDGTFLDATRGGVTIVDFWATWCGPCRSFAPVFAAVAASHDGPVRFASCDVDASPRTAEQLQINSVPTLIVFGPDGSPTVRTSGAMSRRDLEAVAADLVKP